MIAVGRKKFQLRRPKSKKKIPPSVSSSAAMEPPPPPPWIELPRDVTANILHRLGAIEILESAQKVCTTWRRVCQDPTMWRVIDMKNLGDLHDMPYDLSIMCRHAVDRCQGQLIDINIEYFGTDELLRYISQRSNNLRRLRLACCYSISGKALREAVKNFPQLEELHLFFMSEISAGDIESIGTSCRMLKSFTFNDRGYRFPLIECDNEYALAVAKNMPNLCHLRLFGNKLMNEGLEAILNGCPHLESLDIRQCFSVNLVGDLGKRCSEQIKNLRRPCDSTDDYEWDAEIYDCESFDGNYCSSGYSDIYSIGDYDDYTNPFGSEYYSDNEVWFFDHDYF
ncbi:UNVERIFIED_CONTAM: F-box protein SKIP19 [Sesamum calycinum]|uniref:F-box protein SKIP19 n=2 Tax=Sesamum TaxID=4181 RepID=A0AAW2Q761_9LAMI